MHPNADWRARLARRLMISAWRPMRWQRLALAAAVVAAWFASAMWAAWLRQQMEPVSPPLPGRLLDMFYAPFTYLAPQATFAYSHKLLWQEGVARIAAPLIPLLGLFWLLRRRLMTGLADMLMARGGARGHAVITGDNGSADAIAKASSAIGTPVLLCDPSVVGDADRLASLGAAGVCAAGAFPARIARAGTIAIWSAGDVENLARAITVRAGKGLGQRDLFVSLAAPESHRALLQAPDLALDGQVRLRPVSADGNAVRADLCPPEVLERAVARGQRRLALCLWGGGPALGWAAELALRHFWSVRLGAPHIHWVATETGSVGTSDSLQHFAAHAGTVFAPADCPMLRELESDAAIQDRNVTWHLVDQGDDDATLALSFSLAARLRQTSDEPAPVQAVLRGRAEVASLFATGSLAFLPPLQPGSELTVAALCERGLDEAAARIHLAYDREFGEGNTAPASGRWQDLPETYVAANRAAADHIAIKQWDARTSGLVGDALIDALARAEHNRWCAERLLNGWAPPNDGKRDNARRLHPDLRPWDALDETAREKDRAQVRGVIGTSDASS